MKTPSAEPSRTSTLFPRSRRCRLPIPLAGIAAPAPLNRRAQPRLTGCRRLCSTPVRSPLPPNSFVVSTFFAPYVVPCRSPSSPSEPARSSLMAVLSPSPMLIPITRLARSAPSSTPLAPPGLLLGALCVGQRRLPQLRPRKHLKEADQLTRGGFAFLNCDLGTDSWCTTIGAVLFLG